MKNDDEALSTNELIRIMAGSQNKRAKIWSVPAGWWIEALARTGDFLHLPLNSERFTLWNLGEAIQQGSKNSPNRM